MNRMILSRKGIILIAVSTASIISFRCQNKKLGRIYIHEASAQTIYLEFADDNKFTQTVWQNASVQKFQGSYAFDKILHLYNFIITDEGLGRVLGYGKMGSMDAYLDKENCIYFLYDLPDYRFCETEKVPISPKVSGR